MSENFVRYLDKYVLEEGLSRFMFDKPITVACTLKKGEMHLVKTDVIFESNKQEGEFVFCPRHKEFFNIGVASRENLLSQPV